MCVCFADTLLSYFFNCVTVDAESLLCYSLLGNETNYVVIIFHGFSGYF